MTFDKRGSRRFGPVLLAGAGLGVLQAPGIHAQEARGGAADDVYVFGTRDAYKSDASSLGKLAVPLIDVPQSVDTVSEQVLQDRAISDLNSALKNVPGITIGAGEFKSLGTSPTIRGFVARTDMFLDGIRDYGDYYRDPFNLESIEVLEGPSSILFGRGSTGGVIEQASKLPKLQSFIKGTATGGTDDTRRLTLDINQELQALGEGAAWRISAMGTKADVEDRDVISSERWGVAPSLALGLGTPTRLTLAYYHQHNDDIPDYGLPYFGSTPADVPRSNYYGFRSDFMRTNTDVSSIKLDHDFSDSFTISNQLRYASYYRNFRFSEPLIAATVPLTTALANVPVQRNVNAGNSTDTMLWDQLYATVKWSAGSVQNTSVLGIEGGHEKAAPEFDNFTGVPNATLLNPNENLPFTGVEFPRYRTHLSADSVAPFVIDTMHLNQQWEATLGLRWDRFDVDYSDVSYSTTNHGQVTKTDHIKHLDTMLSYRAALTYKPADNGSVYLSTGTSFNPSAEDLSLISSSRSYSLNNALLDPEKNRTYELGTKWALVGGRLDVSGAIFRLEKQNARVPDPNNVLVNVLAGSQRVDGAELRMEGRLSSQWKVIAGYTYLDATVTETAPGAAPVGSPLMNTPKHNLTFWSVYQIQRLELGGGGRFVSSQYTQNVPPIRTVPGFWSFDVMAKFAFTPHVAAQVNVNNLTNRYYYDQLHFFHVVPSEGRTALASVNVDF